MGENWQPNSVELMSIIAVISYSQITQASVRRTVMLLPNASFVTKRVFHKYPMLDLWIMRRNEFLVADIKVSTVEKHN